MSRPAPERPPRWAWLDGRLLPFEQASVPLHDRGLLFAEALYEVVAVAGGRARRLAGHAARMALGAEALGLRGAPDEAGWEATCRELVRAEDIEEGLVYAQLTGGSAIGRHLPPEPPGPSRFFAYVLPHRFPRDAEVRRGIRLASHPDERWARCDLKTTMLLPAVLAKRAARAAGADEALLLGPGGQVREGASSSVLLVEGRRLVAPPPGRERLPGLTGPLVAELAAEAGYEVVREPFDLRRLRAADEVLVVSTTRLVVPAVALDGEPLGRGAPPRHAPELARRLRGRWGLQEA